MNRKEVTKHICRPKSKDFYGTTTWQCGCGMYFTKEQVMERKEKILSDIRYEEQKGVHTYHLCPYCKKNSTRSGKCAECLRKELVMNRKESIEIAETKEEIIVPGTENPTGRLEIKARSSSDIIIESLLDKIEELTESVERKELSIITLEEKIKRGVQDE